MKNNFMSEFFSEDKYRKLCGVLCSVHYLKVRKVPKLNIVTHKNDLPYSEQDLWMLSHVKTLFPLNVKMLKQ